MSDLVGSSKQVLNSAGGPLMFVASAISTSVTEVVLVFDSMVEFVSGVVGGLVLPGNL